MMGLFELRINDRSLIPPFLTYTSVTCAMKTQPRCSKIPLLCLVLLLNGIAFGVSYTVITRIPLSTGAVSTEICATPIELRRISSKVPTKSSDDGYGSIIYDVELGLRDCSVAGRRIIARENFGLLDLAEKRLRSYPNHTRVAIVYDNVFPEAWYEKNKEAFDYDAITYLAIIWIMWGIVVGLSVIGTLYSRPAHVASDSIPMLSKTDSISKTVS